MRITSQLLAPLIVAACASTPSEPARPAPGPVAAVAPTAAAPPRSIELADLDRSADPCNDFYAFTSGSWRAHNPIPAGKPRWSRRAVGRDTNRQQVLALIQEVAARADWPAGSTEQLIGDHYASCMDEAAIEAAGLQPIAPLLAELDAVKTPADLQRAIRRLHGLGIPAPFGATGAFDNHDPTIFQLNVTGGGLGLPDKDAYAKPGAEATALRTRYRAHVARVLGLAGVADASVADRVIALEQRLAAVSLDADAAGDAAATEHKTTYAQLKALAPHVEWDAYFDDAGLAHAAVNVAEPKHLAQVERELKATPLAIWKAYLRWQLLAAASPWLAKPFADEALAFTEDHASRAQRCADLTESLLGEPVGKKYVERYFPPAAKAKVRAIVASLRAELTEHLRGLPWMATETRQKAIEKLELTSLQLGYPDSWKDTARFQIRRDALWANIAQARRFNLDDVRRHIGKPSDRTNWNLPASSPDAYLDPQLNEFVVPAGFLQPPYFDVALSDAANYGTFGVGFAHDLSHTFDATGAAVAADGQTRNWWTDADRQAFGQRAQCLIRQFDGFEIEPGAHHDGKRVIDEALADQTGVHFALRAFHKAGQPGAPVGGFTPDQQFFIAWGQLRGEAIGIEAQRKLIKADTHAMPPFRLIGALANLPEFAEAFACKPGSVMVRPAEQRCAVW